MKATLIKKLLSSRKRRKFMARDATTIRFFRNEGPLLISSCSYLSLIRPVLWFFEAPMSLSPFDYADTRLGDDGVMAPDFETKHLFW